MEYFKIVVSNNIVGVITSEQFVYYNAIVDNLLRCNKERGQYGIYKDELYRDTWMNPTTIEVHYIGALITPIEEEEYLVLRDALKVNDVIEEAIPDEPIDIVEPEIYEDTTTIDFVRSSKIKEMSYTCNKTIENGFDIEMGDGTHHFSLTSQDQLNLINISSMIAQGVKQFAYHADNELSTFYSAEEMTVIINEANAWKTYQLAYFNALKAYINSLETIEEIGAITYGVEIPEEFKTEVLKVLEY